MAAYGFHWLESHAFMLPCTDSSLTKKGKVFFTFNTNLAEDIRKVAVYDKTIWVVGEHTYNLFTDGLNNHSYFCQDGINDAEV